MRNKSFIFLLLPVLTFASLSLFANSNIISTSAENVLINVDDLEENDIRNYYSSLNSLSEDQRKGTSLLSPLRNIIKGHNTVSYENAFFWMRIVDRDWDLSPLSEDELQSYNINGTTDNPKMHLLYRNDNGTLTSSNYYVDGSTTTRTFDREHVWPQSKGTFGTDQGIGTDLHHLIAADKKNNSAGHNNNDWGNTKLLTYNVGDTPYNQTGKLAEITYNGSTGVVYEPQDEDKGDIARAMFYVATRYSSFVSANDPHMELIDGFTGNSVVSETVTGKAGILKTLLEWNELDPVDDFEIHRNNLIYKNVQHNRNPFVDFPSWANAIWGDQKTVSPKNDEVSQIGDNLNYIPAKNGYLKVKSLPIKTNYTVGESLDLSGLTINFVDKLLQENETVSYITSYEDGASLQIPGTIKVFVTSTVYEVLGTSFNINVAKSSGSIRKSSELITKTGFEETEGFKMGTKYQGNLSSSGPENYTWTIHYGNFSTTKPVLEGSSSARIRIFSDKVRGFLKTDFKTENAEYMSFLTSANNTEAFTMYLDVLYSIDNGSTWKNAYTSSDLTTPYSNIEVYKSSTAGQTCFAYLSAEDQGSSALFKFQMGSESSVPTSSSYEIRLDAVKIYGESSGDDYKHNLRVYDIPRQCVYHLNEELSLRNLNVVLFNSITSNVFTSEYTTSLAEGYVFTRLGIHEITITSTVDDILPTKFYVFVTDVVSEEARAFATALTNYKSCSEYQKAYDELKDDYNNLNALQREELKYIYIDDYSYEDYINNGKTYDGLEKKENATTAYDKWEYVSNHAKKNISTTSYQNTISDKNIVIFTLIGASALIIVGTFTTLLIIKKRRHQ